MNSSRYSGPTLGGDCIPINSTSIPLACAVSLAALDLVESGYWCDRVPRIAELAVGGVVLAVVLVADLRGAIAFSSFGVLLYYAVANAAALDLARAEERRAGVIVPVIGLVGCLVLAGSLPLAAVTGGLLLVLAGLTMAQISEHSLIFVATGMSLEHLHNANTAHTHIRFSRTGGHGFTSSLGYRGTLRLRC